MNNKSGSQVISLLSEKLKKAPKWVSFLTLFLVVVVTPVTILLLDNFITPAQSWYNSSWEYRKPITVTNGGGLKTDYDVLVSVDTASLMSENKIQNDCDDIRFVDEDDTTVLSYSIESGCNTSETQIWVRVPSLPNGGKTIHMYYGNGSSTGAGETWTGNILAFNNSTIESATGGTITYSGGYVIHTFTSSGTFTPTGPMNVEVLVVGGGGGGGGGSGSAGNGAGGGAGSVKYSASLAVTGAVSVTVGNGGAGGTSGGGVRGTNGGNSVFSTITAVGGGGGGAGGYTNASGLTGGNGGGGAPINAAAGSSNDGGYSGGAGSDCNSPCRSGGGGGAGGAGTSAVTGPGNGGVGVANSITGTSVYYGGGGGGSGGTQGGVAGTGGLGGGGNGANFGTAASGTANTGGGGGGGGYQGNGGVGGSGIIVVRYPQNSVCPTGWTRVTEADGRFLMGSSTYGNTGGSSSHSHSDVSCTTGGASASASVAQGAGSVGALSSDTHTNLTGTVGSANNTIPPYLDVVLCKNSSLELPLGTISMFTTSAPAGWTRFSQLDNSFPRAASSSGGTGGSASHSHAITGGTSTGLSTNSTVTSLGAATGGTITTSGGYTIHRFTSSGTFSSPVAMDVEYLVVAGGAGGANAGGGGRGGQVRTGTLSISAGNHSVVVGNGGSGGGGTGGNSSFSSISSSGGTYPSPYGDTLSVPAGGTYSSITGTNTLYGIFGAATTVYGGGWNCSMDGGGPYSGYGYTGVANTGGGGSAGDCRSNPDGGCGTTCTGFPGGSGVVVVRYPTPSSTLLAASHSHTSQNTTSGSSSNLPSYVDMIFASKTSPGENVPGMVMMFDTLPPLGWSRLSSLDNKFTRGSTSYGSTGGSNTHANPVTLTTGAPSATFSITSIGATAFATGTHTHSCTTQLPEQSSLPPYFSAIFAQKIDNSSDLVTLSLGSEESNTPAAPTSVPAQAMSTSSIRWNFVDNANNEVGFKVLDGLGEVKATCEGANLSYCDETGLQPNTQYTRYIVAYNSNGDSLQSSEVSRYTLVSAPSVSITSVSNTEMSLSVTGTTNIGSGLSAIFIDCTVTGCESGVETWTTSTTADVTSLSENTQYSFQVKARNGDGVETAYSSAVSNYTYASVPTLSFVSANSSSVTVEVNNVPNLSLDQSGIFYYCSGCVAPAGWVSGSQNTFSGLNPNTQVSITAKARNGDGVETAVSTALVTNSYAAVPLAPVITDIGTNTIRVSLNENTNGNPTSVLYAVKYNSSDYIDPTNGTISVTPVWASFDTWNAGGGVLVGGLEEGVQHTILAIAKNSNDVITGDGASASVYTLLNAPAVATPQVLSDQSIRWMFTDTGNNEEGFKVYSSNGDLLATCVGVNLTYCDETGLNSNTSYTRYVKAYNANTESGASSNQAAVTFSSVPSVIGVSGTQGRISFDVSMNGNPGGTEVLVQDETTGYYYNSQTGELVSSPYWFEYVSTGNDLLINNLQANTEYSLKVMARNSENVETAFSPVSSVYTHAVVPSIESVDGLTPTSLKVVLGTEGNPSTTEYLLRDVNANKYVDDSTGALVDSPVWATYADFGGVGGIDITSLSSNTGYLYEVKARNNDGVETAYSAQTSGYTLSSTPTIENVQNSSATVLIVTIGSSGNPSNTEFAIRENGSGQYVNSTTGVLQATPSWGTYAQWGGVTGFGVTALSPNTLYSFSSLARNLENINSSFSSSQSLYTLANIPGSVTTDSVEVTSLNVVLDPNGNPSTTEFALFISTRSKYIDFNTGNESDSAVWGTYAQWGSSSGYLISGLDSGTTYEFVSKARNGNQVETSFGVGSNVSTSLSAPTIATATRLSETSIRWNFTDNENNEVGYRVYDADGVQVAECVGTNLTSCIEYGMTPNTEYTRKIAAYNNTGRGDYSETVTRYTLAAVPQFSSISAISSTSVKIVLNTNGNPSNTVYQIREVVSGLRVGNLNDANGTLVNSNVWYSYNAFGGSNGVTINELFANAEYVFEVVAKDGEGTVTSASTPVTIYTLAVTPAAPTLTALSDSRLKVVIDNGGNPGVTTFALKDVKSSKYFNYSNGLWVDSPVFGNYVQWGRTNGVSVNGLSLNTEYEYQVISRNGQAVEAAGSLSSKLYTLANVPGRVNVSTNTSNNLVVRLTANSNPSYTEYSVFDLVSSRYLDPRTGTLSFTVRWGTLSEFGGVNGIVLSGLTLGSRVELIAKARNGNLVESISSSSFTAHAIAGIPGIAEITPINLRSARIRLNRQQNDLAVQYSIYEESQQRYVDFRTGLLVAEQVWGTYTEFGGDNGVLVLGLTPVTDYSFRVNARNGAGVITGLGARRTYGTNAIIENVPAGLSIVLKSNSAVDPSKDLGGQRGLQEVRVIKNGKIIADIPVEFSQNRDWNGAAIESQSGRVVVKMNANSGYKGTYSMYVEKGDTNRFKLCTKAEEIDEVNSDCAGSVVFVGPFPQTINVEGKPITVAISVINSVSYWVVSGLTGTGGLGEKIDTDGEVIKEPTDNFPDKEEAAMPETPESKPVVVINTPNQTFNNVVNGAANIVVSVPQQATAAIDGVKIALDNSVVGGFDEPQLTAVSTTATAATVTVGLAAVGGGFTAVPYMITQFFLSVLSFLGFRKKGKPYGYVYNSVSKEPVSRAIVRIYDIHNRLVWTDVTDAYGSFNVELPRGQYKILVKKGGFTYPTEIIKGLVDFPLEPIYKGELFKMSQKTDIKVLIPIDPTDVSKFSAFAVSARTTINTFVKILHSLIFVGGIILAVYTILKFPTLFSWVVLAFYVPAFFMLFRSIFGQQSRYGYVIDQKGKGVANVEIALKELKFDRFVGKRVTDSSGRYRFVMYPGAYEIVVTSHEYKALKFEGGSSVINIGDKSDKVIAKDITVRKK